MSKCPYAPTITDQTSDQVVTNPKYEYWMEGYRALMNEYAIKVESLTKSLRAELKKLKRPETPGIN